MWQVKGMDVPVFLRFSEWQLLLVYVRGCIK